MTAEPRSIRWVLVAGTGLEIGTPEPDVLAAAAVGEELAKHGCYGLVTGGWHGVDWVVTDAFVTQLRRQSLDPKQYLIQVIPNDWSALHDEGHIVQTEHGATEWLDPQKFAEAMILIGGRGGTYRTWLGGLHGGLPRFPIGGVTGDSRSAFLQTLDLWELIPVPGITRAQFEELGRPITCEADARAVARHVVGELLVPSLDAVDALARRSTSEAPSVFICYSHADARWVSRLRVLLRPAERRGLIATWMDADLEPGRTWDDQIRGQLNTSGAALLLVSPHLVASTYARTVEIPALVRRLEESRFRLFWVLLDPCDWRSIKGLDAIQAIGSATTALSQSATPADAQRRLSEIADYISHAMSPPPSPDRHDPGN